MSDLFFCSLTSWIARFFSSSAACAERMFAVWSCSVNACFLGCHDVVSNHSGSQSSATAKIRRRAIARSRGGGPAEKRRIVTGTPTRCAVRAKRPNCRSCGRTRDRRRVEAVVAPSHGPPQWSGSTRSYVRRGCLHSGYTYKHRGATSGDTLDTFYDITKQTREYNWLCHTRSGVADRNTARTATDKVAVRPT